MDVSLSVHRVRTVKEALQQCTAEEVLDADNQYRCDKCVGPGVFCLCLNAFNNAAGGGRAGATSCPARCGGW